ncbi:hypothetical protein SAMN05421890_3330 [Ensifer adhaerens]|nr:hypothetical protein SAMN05421890_3330 [Ensifer adhaerens]
MRIDSLIQSLKVLIRIDSVIADLKFRSRLSQISLLAVALVIGTFGLIMLGIAGYQFLKELWGAVVAALVIAGASFLIALILVLVASAQKPGKELQLAQELHATALDALIAEAKSATGDLTLAGNLLRGRFDSSLIGLVAPLATLLLRALRRKSAATAEKS